MCIGRYRLDDGEKAYSTGDVLEYSPAILTQVSHIYDIYVCCTMLMLLKLGRPLFHIDLLWREIMLYVCNIYCSIYFTLNILH